jgi:hypothetical protein
MAVNRPLAPLSGGFIVKKCSRRAYGRIGFAVTLPEPEKTIAYYDFDYVILILRQAIDFAKIKQDFAPLRKWVNEVEQSGHEMGAMAGRLNYPAGQEILRATLLSVAAGSVSSEDALFRIRRWLNSGQLQAVETELIKQYQFA